MTGYKELAARAREAAASIRNDGTPAQVGLSEDQCFDIASAIEALEAERDEVLADEQKWLERATYEVGAVPHFWDDRARAAEARCKRLEEALREARTWHESEDKSLSKQPPSHGPNGNQWARLQHREQIDEITSALEPSN